MSFLELKGIVKRYPGAEMPCIDGLDLSVEKGEIVVILGESGSGKTTILKMISGLAETTAGKIAVDGECIDALPANKRPVTMVFQRPLLFRNQTVHRNICFGKWIKGAEKSQMEERAQQLVKLMGLEGLEDRLPNQLSGGQEQRVSLARAIMVEPKILLLDEPMSALDETLRASMRDNILNVRNQLELTILLVTHDQQEAATMADRIALLMDGKIIQIAKPEEFYKKPKNRKVAMFFGWRNCVPCTSSGGVAASSLGTFAVEGNDVSGDAFLLIRPDAAIVSPEGRECEVVSSSFTGLETAYGVMCDGIPLRIVLDAKYAFETGDRVKILFDREKMWVVGD
jgi:ABC-type Fe3+/spermidine/putrescine transport system ATPase subunit